MLVPLFLLALGACSPACCSRNLHRARRRLSGEMRCSDYRKTPSLECHHVPAGSCGHRSLHGDRLCGVVAVLYRDPGLPRQIGGASAPLYKFLLNKWYFDELYDLIFVRPAMWLGRFLWKKGDGWMIDGFGPDGVSARVHRAHRMV